MRKSFADVEDDLKFQLDLVKLAEALRGPMPNRTEVPDQHAGMMEELVRVQRRRRAPNRFNA